MLKQNKKVAMNHWQVAVMLAPLISLACKWKEQIHMMKTAIYLTGLKQELNQRKQKMLRKFHASRNPVHPSSDDAANSVPTKKKRIKKIKMNLHHNADLVHQDEDNGIWAGLM